MPAFRPRAGRRGGTHALTLGYLSVGGSSFILLAVGPRLLDPAVFSGLGLIWTISTLFGMGIGAPAEQVINRRMNAGATRGVRAPLRTLVLLGVVSAAGCLVVTPHSAAAQRLPVMTAAMLLAIGGWVVLSPVRGRLAGSGDLLGYSVTLFVESGVRIAIVATALLAPGAPVLLSVAVGLPLWVAAGVGALVRIPVEALPEAGEARQRVGARGRGPIDGVGEYGAFLVVLVGYQICINSAPLLMEWRLGHSRPAVIGAFVAASTYFRIPLLVAGGILTHSLVELSHAWGAGDVRRFRVGRRLGMRRLLVVVIGATVLLAAGSPVLLRLFYGAPLNLPVLVLLALAGSTVLAQAAMLVVQSLLAAGQGRIAAALWSVGSGVTLVLLSRSGGTDWWVAAGLVLGPLAVLVGGLVMERRRLPRDASSEPSGPVPIGDRADLQRSPR